MIKINNHPVNIDKFPDGTFLIKKNIVPVYHYGVNITWLFENNEELIVLMFLVEHLRSHGVKDINLKMPYIPNARQDRVKHQEDVFTLKYFANLINAMNFNYVSVLDPHSYISEALINNIKIKSPRTIVESLLEQKINDVDMMFYPDEGAMKRYSSMFKIPYSFGMKKRDWETGEIKGLDVISQDNIKGKNILIVDDICSRGGTFYHSAKKLKELGANNIYLYISHCENTILEGDLLNSGLIEKVFTTNSIFTKEHEKIEVLNYA